MPIHSFDKRVTNTGLMILLAVVTLATPFATNVEGLSRDIVITVTTRALLEDVKELVCKGDRIELLSIGDADPHHYSLSPEDLAKIENSDLVVTTGHMDFEIRIREKISRGEFRAVLVDPLLIGNISIRYIPGTNLRNLHGVTYDPFNYKLLVTEIYNNLVSLNHGKAECYRENYEKVVKEIDNLLLHKNLFRLKALADIPHVQYAVEWLGIEIIDVIVKEHDLPVDPRTLNDAERLLKNREIDLVIVNYPSHGAATDWLIEKAREHGVPALQVLDPNYAEKTVAKLRRVIDFLKDYTLGRESLVNDVRRIDGAKNTSLALSVALIIGIVTPIIAVLVIKRVRA